MTLATSPAPQASQKASATGTYSDGSSKDVRSSVTWTTSAPKVATVDASGLLTAVGSGNTTITASLNGVSATTQVTVVPQLLSIAITPGNPNVPLATAPAPATTQQLVATGTYNDGSSQNLTLQVAWSSSNPAVASASAGGRVTALTSGASNIQASLGSVSASTRFNVVAQLVSIAVAPGNTAIALATPPAAPAVQQFTATGNYNDGSSANLTNQVTWTSTNASVATVTPAGVVTANANGSTSIQASIASITGGTPLTVNHQLVSVAVTGPLSTMAPRTEENFTATATFNDNATGMTWASSSSLQASVSAAGLATGLTASSTPVEITATLGASAPANASLTVTNADATSISLAPASASLLDGQALTYSAEAVFNDGTMQNITSVAGWSTNNTTVATNSGSTVTAAGVGSVNVKATFGGVSGTTPLTCKSSTATIAAIAISPNPAQINAQSPANTQSLRVSATYSDGTTRILSTGVTYSSSDSTIVSVNSLGTATGVAAGTATVTATVGSFTATANLTISSSPLRALTVMPSSAQIASGTGTFFAAIGTFEDGSTQTLTRQVHWTSSDPSVATVSNGSNSGFALSLAAGTTSIGAAYNSVVSTPASLDVTSATLQTITITPSNATVALGTSQTYKATGLFSDGTTQDISSLATWSSNNAAVMFFNGSASGNTTGAGSTAISASFAGITGTTNVTVQ